MKTINNPHTRLRSLRCYLGPCKRPEEYGYEEPHLDQHEVGRDARSRT